jgi:hypothetical protein
MSGADWFVVSCGLGCRKLVLLEFVNSRSGDVHESFEGDAPRAIQAFAKAI